MTTHRLLFAIGLLGLTGIASAAEFADPVRLEAAGEIIRVEEPGYAAPCLADINGDGHIDLLVGQFNGGKIHVFEGQADGSYAAGHWLEAEGDVAEIPGVW